MGSGVIVKGIKKLVKMLVCMIIGDLDVLLYLKNIDFVKVIEFLKDI